MDEERLVRSLDGLLGKALAQSLVGQFIQLRRDYATKTLERASPGKFVETFVQCLQHMATGTYEPKPDVEDYLLKRVENVSALPEGLHLCRSDCSLGVYSTQQTQHRS